MEENKKVIIIGGAGHGSVVASCINDNRKRFNDFEWELKGFCNDYDSEFGGYPVLGKLCDIPKLIEQGYYFAWGIHLIGTNIKTLYAQSSISRAIGRTRYVARFGEFFVRLGVSCVGINGIFRG